MPIDLYTALNAMLRAETARITPQAPQAEPEDTVRTEDPAPAPRPAEGCTGE